MSAELEKQILEEVKSNPGQKAKDIAEKLGIERQFVNSILHRLKSKFRQDKRSYRWFLKGEDEKESSKKLPKREDTVLTKLCRYYLECLSHDDLGGVSEFAKDIYNSSKYVELGVLPMFDKEENNPFETEEGSKFLGHVKRDRNKQIVYLGYPVRLNKIRSKKGWEGFLVEPILLFAFEDTESNYNNLILSDELPQLNFRALKALSNAGDTNLMEEAIQLVEELGLANIEDDQPELDDLIARLREIRSDWDWQEEMDPFKLSSETPLSNLEQQGIFNRAILGSSETSPYTKGLETELKDLQRVPEDKYKSTALGEWLHNKDIDSPTSEQQPLLEVLPLNSEQRQAVRQSLKNPLTIITGPPGTGKSQVVSSILINTAWQNKTVLFASKNNKAVDVVEARVNSLGPRPILLRMGRGEIQDRLADYLASMLSLKSTEDDHDRYNELEKIHKKLEELSDHLNAEMENLISLRNKVDHLEQQVEHIREEVGEVVFQKVKDFDSDVLEQACQLIVEAIDKADKNKHSFLNRLIWFLIRKEYFGKLNEMRESFQDTSAKIGLPIPKEEADVSSINEWIKYRSLLVSRMEQLKAVAQYFAELQSLSSFRPLEELSSQQIKLTDDVSKNSENLWKAWLRLQPDRLDKEQRKLLGDYSAILKIIVSGTEEGKRLGKDVFKRYYELSSLVSSILSCWAVTALSARGKLPFTPNSFDLLVIDEASQCDISSALPLLYRARRAVIIGDPKQLRHISTLSKLKDQQLLSKHDLIRDFPSWSYSTTSLYDLASTMCRSDDIVQLRDHHRSHSQIIQFSNDYFYEGQLRMATSYEKLQSPNLQEASVRWIDIRGETVRPGSGGAVNNKEAQAVLGEISRLLNQGYRGSIGVVSPFRAQANRIRDLVNSSDGLSGRLGEAKFVADTVHRFQGDEKDVMIFSPVVSSNVTAGALGFLRSNPNLFNVAITRARAALIVVGDKMTALNSNVEYLSKFVNYIDNLVDISPKSQNSEVTDFGPEYPDVSRPAESISEWEKIFYKHLYNAGIPSIPQYHVDKYVLDFAIIKDERRLNIEIDGEKYHRNWDGELCRKDQIRNQRMIELGWDVMRFWVYQVRDEPDQCLTRVQNWINK